MKRRMIVGGVFALIAALCVVCVCGRVDAQAAKAKPTVEVHALQVAGKGYGEGMDKLSAGFEGVTIHLLAKLPQGGLIAFDEDASKLAKFADDTGKKLMTGKSFGSMEGFGMMPRISKDGKACLLNIRGALVPAKKARQVQASGMLVFKAGNKKRTFKQEKVAVKVGTKIKVGNLAFTIKKVGKPQWGDNALDITLHAKQDLSDIAEVKFYDAAGKEIKSKSSGRQWSQMMDGYSESRSYSLAKKVQSFTIAVTCWMDAKQVKVPFDVKASVGL